MLAVSDPSTTHPALADAIFASDRDYFSLAGRREGFGELDLAHMPGLAVIPAGCVALCRSPLGDGARARDVVQSIEGRMVRLGASLFRFYDPIGDSPLSAALSSRGYRRSLEVALIGRARARQVSEITLRPVVCEEDWAAKLALHRGTAPGPDGHRVDPLRWLELERRKQETGAIRFLLAEQAGMVCGTVGVMDAGRMLRMKNLVVGESRRRRGIGAAITRAVAGLAAHAGHEAFGLLASADGPALSMYRRIGLVPVGSLAEWVRPALSAGRRPA